MEISVFNLLATFVVYSFLGWIMESIVRSFCERKIINTGFLIGPVCPIYGAGAILMLLTMGRLYGNYIAIFFISIVMLTTWEYVVGVFLEKVFKTKYWDYSDHKFNFQGRICLTNSIAWGFLGVGFINYIHPFVNSFLSSIDINVYKTIIYSATAVIIVDTIISIIKINNIKIKWDKIKELTDEIKKKTKEIKENGKISTAVDDLEVKRNKMSEKLYKYVYRLKQAFPAINTKEITEILSKKISIKKDTTKEKRRK